MVEHLEWKAFILPIKDILQHILASSGEGNSAPDYPKSFLKLYKIFFFFPSEKVMRTIWT